MLTIKNVSLIAGALLVNSLLGCGGGASAVKDKPSAEKHAEHDHPSKGPHGGQLIELGNEEYHAELLHDEQAGTVTVHLLDGAAKQPVTSAAPEIIINLKDQGQGKQFKLAAAPLPTETAGQSSKFASSDKQLAELLDAAGADAQLVVEIGGKQFRGALAHGH